MKNLHMKRFTLLILALLLALMCSVIVYALTTQELPPWLFTTFQRDFDLWVVTDQAEFEQGVLNNVDTSSSPGDVKLGITSYGTTYDFSSADRWAFDVESDNDPPEANPNKEVGATPEEYSLIAASDDIRWKLPDPGVGDYEWIKSQITVEEDVSSITRIDFSGEAYGSRSDIARIYAYNISTSVWDLVGSGTVPNAAPDATITGSITAAFGDYIDVDGQLVWVFGLDNSSDYLYVDYVKVDINSSATYDFSSVDRWALDVESGKDPPEAKPNKEVGATPDEYGLIAASDDVRWQLPDPGFNNYEWVKSQITVEEDVSSITRIDFSGEAYGSVSDIARIYAYNISMSGWDSVGSGTVPNAAPDATITGSITAAFGDYIDVDGRLVWVFGLGNSSDYLYVDYVKVDVTYSGYHSVATIASYVYDTGEVDAVWDLLGWDKTLPSGTDITFEVRASNTIFNKDAATPAWQDASAIPIVGRYHQWRATLTTTDGGQTPALYEVWDLYSW